MSGQMSFATLACMSISAITIAYTRLQRTRRTLLLTAFLVFPVTLYYFSPVLTLAGATQHIVTGSVIVFGIQFVTALFFGRSFCAWVCPAGAVQELVTPIQRRPTPRWIGWIKYGIWVPWIVFIAYAFIQPGDSTRVHIGAFTSGGISVVDLQGYIVYYAVVSVFLVLSLLLGRRGGCHAICWMAPFMVLGRALRNLFRWPALRLRSDGEGCITCGRCTDACPMSIDVQARVDARRMEDRDCILCGNCVDSCPRSVIRFSFSAGNGA